MLFLVDSYIPARQWTDICNTRCSILSSFSHFHVSHFPPLHSGAAFSCPTISCLAFSASAPCSHRTELHGTGVLNIVNHIYTKMQIKITHGTGGTGSNAKHSPWFSFLTSALYKLHIFYLLTEATFTPNLRVALHCAPA